MSNAVDTSTLERSRPAVKPGESISATYGLGLQAQNDATNLAKKASSELLREYDDRRESVNRWALLSDRDIPELVSRTQALARVEREIVARMERGRDTHPENDT